MKIALAGDTMLGRKVAERLAQVGPRALFADEVVAVTHEADLFVLNLECPISDRGDRWSSLWKPFSFRAPPVAVDVLSHLGVDCVTLANNHALDYGSEALFDTIDHLHNAGIACVGAGLEASARRPAVVERTGTRVAIIGATDHSPDYAAAPNHPGVAFAAFRKGPPRWLLDTINRVAAEIVIVTPHWGPNMVAQPLDYVRSAAETIRAAGATLVAGHSAHVFHGVAERILYDLGDFIDDYAPDPQLRNDLGLLFLVQFDGTTPTGVEAVPLALDYCSTRLADPGEAAWISTRFRRACAALGTKVTEHGGRLVVEWESAAPVTERARVHDALSPRSR
jgi:poly-gamma-glutamate synthesis protein (capsule biosynthesis protein)